MNQQSSLDRRLAETPEPFRSGARDLAVRMIPDLRNSNFRGIPPVVPYVDCLRVTWPHLEISGNLKVISGMLVAEALAPDLVPGRRKNAPRGSCMASGTIFVPAPATSSAPAIAADSADEDVLHLAREALERAAETFSSVKEGHHFDRRRRDHLRLAITALQMANSGLVV